MRVPVSACAEAVRIVCSSWAQPWRFRRSSIALKLYIGHEFSVIPYSKTLYNKFLCEKYNICWTIKLAHTTYFEKIIKNEQIQLAADWQSSSIKYDLWRHWCVYGDWLECLALSHRRLEPTKYPFHVLCMDRCYWLMSKQFNKLVLTKLHYTIVHSGVSTVWRKLDHSSSLFIFDSCCCDAMWWTTNHHRRISLHGQCASKH